MILDGRRSLSLNATAHEAQTSRMSTAPTLYEPWSKTVSVEEYLASSYEPDLDLVDGHLEERNLGEYEHGRLQLMLGRLLGNHEREWGVYVVTECRLQVQPGRFRVPDLRPGRVVS